MKKILSIILMFVMILTATSCGVKNEGILGTWQYSASEDGDPDMKDVVIEINEDVLSFIREDENGSMMVENTYEKDDDIIYVISMTAIANGEVVDFSENEEFLEIPYVLSDDKLILDLDEMDLGRVVMERAD